MTDLNDLTRNFFEGQFKQDTRKAVRSHNLKALEDKDLAFKCMDCAKDLTKEVKWLNIGDDENFFPVCDECLERSYNLLEKEKENRCLSEIESATKCISSCQGLMANKSLSRTLGTLKKLLGFK